MGQGVFPGMGDSPRTGDNRSRDRGPDVNTFIEQLSLTNQALMAVRTGLGLQPPAMAILNKSIQMFSKAFQEANKLQTQTLQTNRTVSNLLQGNTLALAKMPGSLSQAIESKFTFLEAGLAGAGDQSMRLASVMKLTGSDIKGLVNINREALSLGRVSTAGLEQLNQTIYDTTRTQGISFSRLVGAVNKLSSRMMLLGALGLTKEVMDAQVKMIGRLGAGSDQLVSSLFEKIFDPNAPMATEMMTGVFNQLQTLRSPGGMTQDNLDKFVSTLGGSFTDFRSMVEGLPVQIQSVFLENTAGGFGGMGGTAAALESFTDNMSAIDQTLTDTQAKFDETLEGFTNRVWKPLQVVFMKLFGGIMKFISTFSPAVAGLVTALTWNRIFLAMEGMKMRNAMAQLRAAIMLKSAGAGAGLLGVLGGPVFAIAAGAAAALMTATMTPSLDAIADNTAAIAANTDPGTTTSMFADRSSTIIKESIAATIFGGNELLAAINSGQMELAGSMLRVGDILLEEREDKGVPGSPF